jgi:hypothetical protein
VIHDDRTYLLRVETNVAQKGVWEYGRIYSGLRTTKRRRRILQREKMKEGTAKLEKDSKEGRGYSSGCRLREEDEDNNEPVSEGCPAKKRARTDNKLTRTSGEECKCGGKDHKRISSMKCPWKGQSKEAVAQNYAKRLESQETMVLRASQSSSGPTGNPTVSNENNVQSTSK